MKIGVIQATSQAGKNKQLYQCTVNAVAHNHRQDEVINFGVFGEEGEAYSYIEIAVAISLLLASGAVDFVVTGCSSGQGMMLACNSLPSVLCGFVQNPQDAFLFGRINGGNAVSVPLGLNFGWLGEINLQCTLDKLFEGEFGCGYPPAEAARKKQDTEALKQLNRVTKQLMEKVFAQFDRALLRKALGLKQVRQYVLENGTYEPVVSLVRGFEQ